MIKGSPSDDPYRNSRYTGWLLYMLVFGYLVYLTEKVAADAIPVAAAVLPTMLLHSGALMGIANKWGRKDN